MGVMSIKKYKIIKDENGNKIQVLKTKEEWAKETKNGTAIWYFYTRYKINNQIKQYKSGVFALKRNAEEEERLFKINPLEYIKTRSKKAKNTLKNNNTNSDAKTLNDYFEEFCNYKSHFVKDSVIYEYKIDWKNHIKEYFENKTLINIDYTLARQWYNDTINISFSISSKNKWLSCLKEFFKYLKSNNLIEFNYFKDLEIFKNPKENKNTIKKIKYQTIEEYEFFMSEINEEDFWYAFFNFIFWHGCRIGEQRALKIKDINFATDTIHFHLTFSKSQNGGEQLSSIKNNKERYISLSPHSKKYLQNLISFYKQLEGYNDNWFLFGGPIKTYKNRIEEKLKKLYRSLKEQYPDKEINELTHHEFGRHSHASHLLNKGLENGLPREVIYEIIAERLGDTIEVIRKTYAHPYENKYSEKTKQLIN